MRGSDLLHARPWRKEDIGTAADVDQAQPSAVARLIIPPPPADAAVSDKTWVTKNHRPTPSALGSGRSAARAPSRLQSFTSSRTRRVSPSPASPDASSNEVPACSVSGPIDTACLKAGGTTPPFQFPLLPLLPPPSQVATSVGISLVAPRSMRISASRFTDSAESAAHCKPTLDSLSS